MTAPRAHRGRARNDEVRLAILEATHDLLLEGGLRGLTIEGVARRARVGKQTIYRWWPTRPALILEATTERAQLDIQSPDTGTLRGDLEVFLRRTFALAADTRRTALLRALAAEAQSDPEFTQPFRDFTAQRRAALAAIVQRGADRGELPPGIQPALLIDVAFGLLWYRLLIEHAPLDDASADGLARLLSDGGEST